MMALSGHSESYCWELEVVLDTHTGQTTITSKKDRILIIDLTSEVPDLSEDLTPPLVDLTHDECEGTCNLTSTPCPDVPVIDLTDNVNIIPVIDLTDDDDISDMVTPSNSQPEWVLHEWEPRDFDSPQSPTYNCNRGMPASYFDSPQRPAPPSSPSSVDSIDVGSPFFYIGSPIYIPASPVYNPLSPENGDDISSSSSFSDNDSGYGGMVRED